MDFTQINEYLNDLISKLDWLDPSLLFSTSSLLVTSIGLIVALALGVALIGWGGRLFRLWMIIAGAYIGLHVGRLAGMSLSLTENWIPYVICAVAGAILFGFLFRACISIAGFVLGAYLGWRFIAPLIPDKWHILAMFLLGIAGTILATWLTPHFISLATSFTGATLVVNSLWMGLILWPAVRESLVALGVRETTLRGEVLPAWLIIPVLLITAIGYLSQDKVDLKGRSRRSPYRGRGRGRGGRY